MSTPKHSPGPWRSGRQDMVSYSPDGGPWKNIYRPQRAGDPLHLGEVLPVEVARAFGDTEDEVLANAHLIAAAPRMLELLREIAIKAILVDHPEQDKALAALLGDVHGSKETV